MKFCANGGVKINIKIAIVDDNLDFLDMLKQFLSIEKDFTVVGAFANKEGILSFIENNKVDVILLDVNLTGNQMDGITLINDIQRIKNTKIIMVSGEDQHSIFLDSFEAGAVQFVPKLNFCTIPYIIRNVVSLNYPVQILACEYKKLKKEQIVSSLTNMEKEIIDLSFEGNDRNNIAVKTNKSISTIRNQISSLLKKLKSKNLKEAVLKIKE